MCPYTCIRETSKYLKVLLMLQWSIGMKLYVPWISYQQIRYYSNKYKKNCHSTKVTHKLDYYILHPVLLTIKSLLINTIIIILQKKPVKTKRHWCTNNIKMENNEFQRVLAKVGLSPSKKNFVIFLIELPFENEK